MLRHLREARGHGSHSLAALQMGSAIPREELLAAKAKGNMSVQYKKRKIDPKTESWARIRTRTLVRSYVRHTGMGAVTNSRSEGVANITLPEVNIYSSSITKQRTGSTESDTWGRRMRLTVRSPKATSGVQNIIPSVRRKCRLQ